MNCRLALERSKAPIAILRNNASSALERGGASNTPNICWPCGSIAETAPGMPIGPRSVTACSQQMKTDHLYHENPQRDCITLDRTLRFAAILVRCDFHGKRRVNESCC